MVNPEQDLANYLGANVAALTLGTNLFWGPIRAEDDSVPDKAVFILTTTSSPPEAFIGETESWWRHGMQAFVRSSRDDFSGGLTLARAVLAASHYAVLSGSYFDCLARDSSPIYIGADSDRRHQWSVAVEAIIKE